jgi:tRNA (cytidine56-2'-O)-methyltransferase
MITILRLGHRPERDKRITTHVALTARAFGADKIIISTKDENLEHAVNGVTKRFGGPFEVRTGQNWRRVIKEFNGPIVHLTMYGDAMENAIKKIDIEKDILIVVGATKVPASVYQDATYNVSVGNQPHSEVAALAVFLDRLTAGDGLKKKFTSYEMCILPDEKGKNVVQGDWVPDRAECLAMLAEEGVQDKVKEHVIAVAGLAVRVGERMREAGNEVDLTLVEAGALLHDIGRSRTHGIMHAIEGTRILADNGVSPRVIGIVRNHIGAGMDKEEAAAQGLPHEDFIPQTLEQKIVAACDNLFSGSERTTVAHEIKHLEKKGLAEAARKVGTLHKHLSELCKADLDDIS